MSQPPPAVQRGVPLAPRTTLGLGGPAEYLLEAVDEASVGHALAWADTRGMPVTVLGGGSNAIVPDAGVPGLTLVMAQRGVTYEQRGATVYVTAAAGEPWDALVEATVARDLAGLECLAGIPGSCGAVPIQNVGAYGQEVSQTLLSVRVFDRSSGQTRVLDASQCGFGYRDSAFKRHPERAIVLGVRFALSAGGAPELAYRELVDAVGGAAAEPTLAEVRDTVLRLRRSKSMVLDPSDPNRRSAGSFFTNPVVAADQADRVAQRALEQGLIAQASEMPRFDAGAGKAKLAAGWLVERAGFPRGTRRGAVGVSSKHALALVHHGGGTTAELLALAEEIRAAVHARFEVELRREPVLLG